MSAAPRPVRVAPLADGAAEESWAIEAPNGGQAARASIWTRATPSFDGRRTGVIGHYTASDAASGRLLLEHICARLAGAQCSVAIGPMDGTTWRKYRLVVEHTEPAFFLDVDTPDDWPSHFRGCGFSVAASYFSTRVDVRSEDPRVGRAADRLDAAGVRIRQLDRSRLDAEMAAIHELSLISFRDAFLYTPIDADSFAALYRPLLPRVDPRFVLMAEHEGRLAGVIFAVPDMHEPGRGGPLRTLVVKTLAVLPSRVYAGLGAVLLSRAHANGLDAGLDQAIHALMHESNRSRALSGHWNGRQIRRYELFARDLA